MDVVRKPNDNNGQNDDSVETINVVKGKPNNQEVHVSEVTKSAKTDNAVEKKANDVEEVSTGKKNKKKIPKYALYATYAVLVFGLIAVAGYFYNRYNDLKMNPKAAISKNNQAETNRVLEKLKKAMLVNETDAPTVARVEEPEKLKTSNPEFYKDIQTGDYLIIYPKRAIIYREQEDKIINFAPIINTKDLEQQTQSTEQPAEEETTPAPQKTTR